MVFKKLRKKTLKAKSILTGKSVTQLRREAKERSEWKLKLKRTERESYEKVALQKAKEKGRRKALGPSLGKSFEDFFSIQPQTKGGKKKKKDPLEDLLGI